MNLYMEMQIRNMKMMLATFVQSCEMAARQDDGKISREEQEQLNQIKAAAQKFEKELTSIQ